MSGKTSPTAVIVHKPETLHEGGRSSAGGKAKRKAASPKQDARVRRTRDVLGDALVELMHQKPFDEITVQQVLDRAHVGRSTFYMHYRDKNDLFLSDAEDFFEAMATCLSRRRELSNRVAPVREFFTHVAEWHEFHTAFVASGKVHDIMELGQGHFARSIEQRVGELPAARAITAPRYPPPKWTTSSTKWSGPASALPLPRSPRLCHTPLIAEAILLPRKAFVGVPSIFQELFPPSARTFY